MICHRYCRGFAASCALLLLLSQAPAQDQTSPLKPQEGPLPVIKATTRLVAVDVVALDNQGRPVTDLKAGDFTVLEENEEQEIKVFSFQHPAPADAVSDRSKLPRNVFTNAPSFRSNSSFNVLLLDAVNTQFENQAYAQQEILAFLKKMPSEQPVAIYALAGNKVQLLQDFTTDIGQLESAAKKFRGQNSLLLSRPSDTADNPRGGRAGGVTGGMAGVMQRVEADRIRFRVDYTVAALTYIAQSLAGYPGRKNLIWISEAFPFDVRSDLQVSGAVNLESHDEDVAKAANALINSQVAIYPLDPRGLSAPSFFSASNSGRDSNGQALRGADLQNALSDESNALWEDHGTMNEMASRTGGRAFYNRNDLAESIRRSIDDGSTYYTLGYYPDNKKWDGRFRKIHVKVNREGIKLRYRLGYYAVDPQQRREPDPKKQEMAFIQALNLEVPASASVIFQAGVAARSSATKDKLPVDFTIDPRSVVFDQQADGAQHAKVNCGGRVYTDKGKALRLQSSTVEVRLSPESFLKVMQYGLPCKLELDLPNGNYLVRLGVMDNRSGLIGTTNAKMTVP